MTVPSSASTRRLRSLRNIVDLAAQLPPALRQAVEPAVVAYVNAVVTDEWPALARRQCAREASAAIDTLLGRLGGEAIAAAAGTAVQGQLLQQAIVVRSLRDQRIALSQTHVNPLKWLGMAFLGFLTMVSIAMVHIDQPRAQLLAVLLFATAAAPTAAIILIHGNPFQEPMAVRVAPIAAATTGAPALP